MTPVFILGRRHGAPRSDDPVLIAGPTYSRNALAHQFKHEFRVVREHPEFQEVWLYSATEEHHAKFSPSKAEPQKAESKKGKKKNEEL